MIIPPLYHWSPYRRRRDIEHEGLVPGREPTIGTISTVHEGRQVICLSSTPSAAWGLSGQQATRIRPAGSNLPFEDEWDLWQVNITPDDEVHVLPFFGRVITEVRVANPIPAQRIWWVARRTTKRT